MASKDKEKNRIYMAAYRLANREALLAYGRSYRASNIEKRRAGNLAYMKAWRLSNPEQAKARDRAQYKAHRATRLAEMRAYAVANREAVRMRQQAWVKANQEKVRVQNRLRMLKWYRANKAKSHAKKTSWDKAYPEKSRSYAAKRRAQQYKMPIDVRFTEADWKEILEAYDGKCAYCGEVKKLTRDHIIPLSKGGHHVKDNIRPACHSCNSKKGNRDLPVLVQREAVV